MYCMFFLWGRMVGWEVMLARRRWYCDKDDTNQNFCLPYQSRILVELGRTKEDVLILLVRAGKWLSITWQEINSRSMGHGCYSDWINAIARLHESGSIISGSSDTDCRVRTVFRHDRTNLKTAHASQGQIYNEVGNKSFPGECTCLFTNRWTLSQDGYPLRVKHLIYYNEPSIVDAMFKISEAWISEKIKKRVSILCGTIQTASLDPKGEGKYK